jgi:hypothetical protein
MKHGFAQLIVGIIAVVIAVILISSVVMPIVVTANATTWGTSANAMWGVVPIVVIAGLIVLVVNAFM